MATSYNSLYDQFSSSMAEEFLDSVTDNIFTSNLVFQQGWEEAERRNAGRTLDINILTGKNQTATAVGQNDEISSSAQTILSTASFPWSFYVVSVPITYQELKISRGRNERVNLVGVQVETSVASLADLMGNDLCNITKGQATQNAVSAYGITEACDDGTLVNLYGNILRTGAGSFPNWPGQTNRSLLTSNLGTATNDLPYNLFASVFARCTQGAETPTEIYTTVGGVGAYMYAQQSQQRVAPMDIANFGMSGANVFNAPVVADQHIPVVLGGSGGTKEGANFYFLNRRYTKFYYMGEKGFEFIPWVDLPNRVGKVSRYITSLQYAASQCRTNGLIANVNSINNL